MAGDKTLIAYASRSGVDEEYASVIAKVLRDKYGLEVDVINLRKNKSPDITPYRNVIIGSGIRMQKWYKEARKFLKNDFGDRKVAIFLASGEAGDPEQYDEAYKKYITNVLAEKPHIKPVAAEAFGGIIKILGRIFSDGRDMEKASAWADELGKKLSA